MFKVGQLWPDFSRNLVVKTCSNLFYIEIQSKTCRVVDMNHQKIIAVGHKDFSFFILRFNFAEIEEID